MDPLCLLLILSSFVCQSSSPPSSSSLSLPSNLICSYDDCSGISDGVLFFSFSRSFFSSSPSPPPMMMMIPTIIMLKMMPNKLSLIPMMIHLRKIIRSLIKNASISRIINIIVVVVVVLVVIVVVGFKLQKKV